MLSVIFGDTYGYLRYPQGAPRRAALAYAPSREPDGFKPIRTGHQQQKSRGEILCFLLVTRTGLEPMLPP